MATRLWARSRPCVVISTATQKMTTTSPPENQTPSATAPVRLSPAALFAAFSAMALSGFGGVMPFAYRALVERRQWLTSGEFASMLALAQVLPGPTICNLSLMVGWRYAGLAGALAALSGMLAGPIVLVLVAGSLVQRYASIPEVGQALAAMGAVAAGLLMATGLKMGIALFKMRRARVATILAALITAAAFVGVGLMRWPLITVVLVLAPLAVWQAWRGDL